MSTYCWLYDQMREWTTKFNNKNFIELTGDSQTPIPDLNKYDVILTTPEKWDVVTRRFLSSIPGRRPTNTHFTFSFLVPHTKPHTAAFKLGGLFDILALFSISRVNL